MVLRSIPQSDQQHSFFSALTTRHLSSVVCHLSSSQASFFLYLQPVAHLLSLLIVLKLHTIFHADFCTLSFMIGDFSILVGQSASFLYHEHLQFNRPRFIDQGIQPLAYRPESSSNFGQIRIGS
jgi:hypothetical protein